jgi:hypothetical protein
LAVVVLIAAAVTVLKSAERQGRVLIAEPQQGEIRTVSANSPVTITRLPRSAPADAVSECPRLAASGRPPDPASVPQPGSFADLHRVGPSEDVLLAGRVAVIDRSRGVPIPPGDMAVSLVQSGTIRARVEVDADGVFRATVPPGVYSLVAVGSGGFAASSVHVLRPGGGDEAVLRQASSDGREDAPGAASAQIVEVAAAPPGNFKILQRLIERNVHIRPQFARLSAGVPGLRAQGNRAHVATAAGYDQPGARVVRLRQDGQLIGQIRRLDWQAPSRVSAAPLSVFFIRDGELAAKAVTDEQGRFALGGLETGVYTVLAAGPEGFTAFDVEVAPPRQAAASSGPDGLAQPVSVAGALQDEDDLLEGSLIPTEDAQAVLAEGEPNSSPPPANTQLGVVGATGGGTAAGGGGGGPGGGLAAVLAGAGIAAGVAIAVSDRDHEVASPFQP